MTEPDLVSRILTASAHLATVEIPPAMGEHAETLAAIDLLVQMQRTVIARYGRHDAALLVSVTILVLNTRDEERRASWLEVRAAVAELVGKAGPS